MAGDELEVLERARAIAGRVAHEAQLVAQLRDADVVEARRGQRTFELSDGLVVSPLLTEYLSETGMKARYLHADVETLERSEILRDLRLGVFDVLVGINLLREGLDLPEVALVGILDADREGFLRSERSLVQTFGRAARNLEGRVLLYADSVTDSMRRAMDETDRRRSRQVAHNAEHGIVPRTITTPIRAPMVVPGAEDGEPAVTSPTASLAPEERRRRIADLRRRMHAAAARLDFEEAARLRDEALRLEKEEVGA